MNQQPFHKPPKHWPPKLNKLWMRLCRPYRMRTLRGKQKMRYIDVQGLNQLRKLIAEDVGILITPNHSFHYDSFLLFEAAHRLKHPFYLMTAWQVFAMSNRLERWGMQQHGCFSVDRENNDTQALRQAVSILQNSAHPLVIFPEGEIYHTNDRVTPFREGAATIALLAARKSKRPIACVPCGLKCWYVKDPTPDLLKLMDRLEQRLLWRPRPDLPLMERVYRLAEGLLSLKEIEYLGKTQSGSIKDRRLHLANVVLTRQEEANNINGSEKTVPDRVRELRRHLIKRMEKQDQDPNELEQAQSDMADLFFVIQLFSYPGDYVREKLTIERIAETLDKLEEDILRTDPKPRGARHVVVRFGEPIFLPKERQPKDEATNLTLTLQEKVQGILNDLNAEYNGLNRGNSEGK